MNLTGAGPGVRLLTLSQPAHLRALTAELLGEPGAALDDVDRDEQCRVLILSGAGRGFCAGTGRGSSP
jgi:enoyl-CoA hydratase